MRWPTDRRAWLHAGLGLAAGLALAALGLCAVAWLALYSGLLPDIDRLRPRIQAEAARQLGTAVEIGHVELRTGGFSPTFELRDVTVRDSAGRAALVLPQVLASVSLRSLVGLEPRLEQLRMDKPTLEVRRDTHGRLTAAGLELGGSQPGASPAAADWLFRQFAFVIHGGSVRWVDEQRAAPPLVLTEVEVELRNGLRSHALNIAATPPPDWGARLSVQGRFTQPLFAHAGDWQRWSGTLAVSLPRADVGELRSRVDLPFALEAGTGALHGTLELHEGQLRAATADLTLQAVRLRLAPGLEPLALTERGGHLDGRRDAGSYTLAARQLGFVTADGGRWPAGDLGLVWRQADGQPPAGGEFTAQRLDLAQLARLAAQVPLGAALQRLLAELAPQGVMTGLAASWTGSLDQPSRYRVKAAVADLTLRAKAAVDAQAMGRPGLSRAQLSFDASETGGTAHLGLGDGAVELPGLWAEPLLPLAQLQADLSWRIGTPPSAAAPRPLSVHLRAQNLANADMAGDFTLDWRTGEGSASGRGARFPGRLDLSGRLSRASAGRVARYLPLGVPASARDYVAAAVRSGDVTGATFRVRGDLWDFPYAGARSAPDSLFHVEARLRDVECACVPPQGGAAAPAWPAFTQLAAELVFDRAAMEIRNAQAQVRGLALTGVQARIADLGQQPLLAIGGRVRGPLNEMLHFVDATPVGVWTGRALAPMDGSGDADLQLALAIPLREPGATTVKGSLGLDGNELHLAADMPALGAVRARIDFSEQGWSVQGGRARLLGGDATVDGGSRPDGSLRVDAQGSVSAEGLRRAGELGPLAPALGGQTRYRLQLDRVHGQNEFTLTSDLVGLALALPAPWRKNAETPLALRVHNAFVPASLLPGQVPLDTLKFELGPLLQAQFERALVAGAMQVQRGAIGMPMAPALPASGVSARLHVDSLNLDDWQQATAHAFEGGGTAGVGAPAATRSGYLPDTVALEAQELRAGPARATAVVASAHREGPAWHVDVAAGALALGGRPLGRVELAAQRDPATAPGASDPWLLTRLLIASPEARLEGHGAWAPATAPDPGRSTLDFKLALDDSGAFLDAIGIPQALKGGKGSLAGRLSWPGPLWEPVLARLSGQLNLALASGRFLKTEPGAARLLSVLSLQSLPRRLALDFRDVFESGFAFDDVSGDVAIAQGVASTSNLRMRGAQAAVLMEGTADIVGQTQDLHVVVVPEINAGTASLAYAVINPALGLGTFLAQAFLRQPLMRAATREFRVSGPWTDPKVEALDHPATK